MFLVTVILDVIDPMAWEPEDKILEKEFLIIGLVAGIIMILVGTIIGLILYKKNKTGKDK